METRKITIANTKTQKRYTFETNASTLGELMVEMDNKGIDYSGMSFNEGLSKVELLDRNSILPTNVMYKGVPTNNLVILLTNNKKNIASGGDRKEFYNYINIHPELRKILKNKYNKNYTVLSNKILFEEIKKHRDAQPHGDATCDLDSKDKDCAPAVFADLEAAASEVDYNVDKSDDTSESINQTYFNIICNMITIGVKIGILTSKEIDNISKRLEVIVPTKQETHELSCDDIDNIINNF